MNKNKLKGLAACLSAALIVTACGKEEQSLYVASSVAVEFTGAIGADAGEVSAQTRMEDDQFKSTDSLGVYMVANGTTDIVLGAENKRYTYVGSGYFYPSRTSETIYFPVDENQKVDFIAYYPRNRSGREIMGNVIDGYTYKANVLFQSRPQYTDLLYAQSYNDNTAGYDKNNTAVTLRFAHQMSKLVVKTRPGLGLTEDDLKNMTITLTGMYTRGHFDLLNGSWSNYSDAGVTFDGRTVTKGERYEAILLPATSGAEGEWKVEFHINGDVYTWEVPADTPLEKGMEHHWEISVQHKSVQLSSQIIPWDSTGDGGNGVAE